MKRGLPLLATVDSEVAYHNADYVIVATSTNYDPKQNFFDTSTVEQTIANALAHAPQAAIVIKLTILVRFVAEMREKLGTDQILFSPEFLREGRALHNNLHPRRIIVRGGGNPAARLLKPNTLVISPLSPYVGGQSIR